MSRGRRRGGGGITRKPVVAVEVAAARSITTIRTW